LYKISTTIIPGGDILTWEVSKSKVLESLTNEYNHGFQKKCAMITEKASNEKQGVRKGKIKKLVDLVFTFLDT